jgi:hypothetical protein
MTDFNITNGKAEQYPAKHYGAHFTGSRATFCLERDFAGFDANVLAIPNLPVAPLTASPVQRDEKFFGSHIKYRENNNESECSIGAVRSHDLANGKTRWQYIEPSDNVWDFDVLDNWVNANYAAGRDILFTLFGTPQWASARPTERNAYSDQDPEPYQYNRGITAEPSDMSKWDRFCAKVAARYKGKIKYYEVWNEPNYQNDGTGATGTYAFFSGTHAKLAEIVRRANQAIKAIDPGAKIICPATTVWATTPGGTAEQYFTGMLAASSGDAGNTPMKNWIDIVGVHLYIGGNDITKMSQMIDRVKAAMTTAGVSDKELWDTESAPISPDVSAMSVYAAKLFIARSMIIQAAKGVARTFYFQYDEPTMGIKRTGIVSYRERIRELLMSGKIQAAYIFTDGRVGYYTPGGLSII